MAIFTISVGADTTSQSFTVVPASMPIVGLGSNVQQVGSPSAQVVLTATDVSGGGSSPLYTFAWDGAMTNIIHAESSQNQLTLTGWVLGSNKVYVRMRTSDTCYVSQTALDSIIIILTPAVTLPFPPAPVIAGTASGYCKNAGVQTWTINNIPPPSDSVTVHVQLDGSPLQAGTNGGFEFSPSSLSTGAHTVMAIFSNSAGSDTTRQSFMVVPALTPLVRLSSNIQQVGSASAQVVLTAANVSGGGSSPSFTFALDAGFIQILQAESSQNQLTLSGSDLQVGSSTIYVRMRTSDTCYTTKIAKDSLIIVRSSVAGGLIDPDYPGQPINCNPNPFYDHLTVTGLQVTKTYTLQLLDGSGKEMARQIISAQSQVMLTPPRPAKGIYLLRIYDENRKRVIGTIRVATL
jgi:hypothetical protein